MSKLDEAAETIGGLWYCFYGQTVPDEILKRECKRMFKEGAKWLLEEARKRQYCSGHPYKACKCERKEVNFDDLAELIEGE